MFTLSWLTRRSTRPIAAPGAPPPGRHAPHETLHAQTGAADARTPALHARAAAPAGRLAMDLGARRAGAAAIRGVPDQSWPGAALHGDRQRSGHRDRVDRPQDAAAVHHHGHRIDLGTGCLRPLPVRARVLLGRRGQHAGAGVAHDLADRAVFRCRRRGASDVAGAGRLCFVHRQRHAIPAEIARRAAPGIHLDRNDLVGHTS